MLNLKDVYSTLDNFTADTIIQIYESRKAEQEESKPIFKGNFAEFAKCKYHNHYFSNIEIFNNEINNKSELILAYM